MSYWCVCDNLDPQMIIVSIVDCVFCGVLPEVVKGADKMPFQKIIVQFLFRIPSTFYFFTEYISQFYVLTRESY